MALWTRGAQQQGLKEAPGRTSPNAGRGHSTSAKSPTCAYSTKIEQPGDHLPWVGGAGLFLGEIEQFVTGKHDRREVEWVLAIVMLVQSVNQPDPTTAGAADPDTASALERACREEVARARGQVMSAGAEAWAAFDGPSRAVGCAIAICTCPARDGVLVRVGLHLGDFDPDGNRLRGTTVATVQHITQRARPGEILISGAIKDLVAGSGFRFAAPLAVTIPDRAEPLTVYAAAG